jgi:hypothetical protein
MRLQSKGAMSNKNSTALAEKMMMMTRMAFKGDGKASRHDSVEQDEM